MPTCSRRILLRSGPLQPGTALQVLGRSASAPEVSTLTGSTDPKEQTTTKSGGLATGFACPLICRDELVQKGIAMNNIHDWQAVHGKTQASKGPIEFIPYENNRKEQCHLRKECRNKEFGSDGATCGEEGWLQCESLDQWFAKFGRPIACQADVSRYSMMELRPPPRPFLEKDKRISLMRCSRPRRLFAEKVSSKVLDFPEEWFGADGGDVRQRFRLALAAERPSTEPSFGSNSPTLSRARTAPVVRRVSEVAN